MTDSKNTPPSSSSAIGDLGFIVVAALIGLVVYFIWSAGRGGGDRGGLAVGQPMPPISAQGWLNGDAPTAEGLAGKVVVIEAWATW